MAKCPTLKDLPDGRPFIKMHGLLNHFVIVDGRETPFEPGVAEVVRICDRQRGMGADQLIIVESPRDAGADAFMKILNVDGREVEACGNATCCVAWLLMEESGSDAVVIETLAGNLDCRRTGDYEVGCTMGQVSMDWQKIPLAHETDTCHVDIGAGPLSDGVALNIGNPHIVYFVTDVDTIDLVSCAPKIQQSDLFPNGVNVGIAELVSGTHLRSRVYERGAGLTTACGSGACVAAYAALARGLTDEREIKVSMPAGYVTVEISDDGVATMTGSVAYSFSGYI